MENSMENPFITSVMRSVWDPFSFRKEKELRLGMCSSSKEKIISLWNASPLRIPMNKDYYMSRTLNAGILAALVLDIKAVSGPIK